MSKRLIALIVMVAVLVCAMLCIPGTYSKYSDSKVYRLRVATDIYVSPVVVLQDISTKTSEARADVSYTTDKAGYYIIIAKGGNGAGQMNCSSSLVGKSTILENGASGGLIASKVYLEKDVTVYASVGSAGSNGKSNSPSWGKYNGDPGTGGKNKWNVSVGGSGGNHSGVINYGTAAASGGGGAATIVLYGSKTIKSMDNLMIIAGGGGSGSAYDTGTNKMDYNGGIGGKGGANYGSNSSKSTLVTNYGLVYDGTNGGGDSNCYGIAGTINPGNGYGTGGALYTSGGAGGSVSSGNSSGAGGGGYAGGGAGKDNSYSIPLSTPEFHMQGGGGGSSYLATIKYKMSTLSSDKQNREYRQYADIMNATGYSTTGAGGFVIIAYAGEK